MTLEETLKRIEQKLMEIETEIKEIKLHMVNNSTITTKSLTPLPDHLRKTAMGLLKIGHGTAGDVSRYTKRARAVESGYLNQLERQGFVTSLREGRRKVFSIESNLREKMEKQEI